ncbi:NUDIX domain-containing protein [Aurantimonas manganoxydans]|uniref:NUDIX domain-containing protein n=1 Tax=Aurantimonas manganoxydans TaxID=651183 RepID=UPI00031644C1|nr:NUDIX domain-containing protein [Aurantimonas manganoxydans]
MPETSPRPLLGVSCGLVGGDRLLLVERGRSPFAGKLSLPGGKLRFGEVVAAAARRELAEETGAVADNLAFVTLHEAIDPDFHAVIAVFGGRLTADSELAAADDAAALHWLALPDIEAADAAGCTTPGLYDVARKVLATCAEN